MIIFSFLVNGGIRFFLKKRETTAKIQSLFKREIEVGIHIPRRQLKKFSWELCFPMSIFEEKEGKY